MDSSNVLIVNTKEYARVMGKKVVELCIKFRANLRFVEGHIFKILGDVRI